MSWVAMLRKVSFFTGASDRDLETLTGHLGKRTFGRGMIIFHKGGRGQSLYIIESGKVRIFILSETGQEISVNVYGPGDVFGELALLDGLPRSAGAVAMEKTVTLTLNRGDFLRHLEACPGMVRGIIEVLAARVRYTTAYAESLSFLDVYGRVAAKLLELADRYGLEEQAEGQGTGAVAIDLRLTQTELATWVSATRESVNKVLRAFRDQGLIEIEGQRVILLDRQGLQRRILY